MRIVIGEDEILIAEHLSDIVTSFKYEVVGIGHNKEEILTLLKKTKPDLVLLDIRMKNKFDGIDIANYILHNYAIPFIFITAHSDKEIIEKALPTKPSGYIIKPFKPMDVYTAIKIATERFRSGKSDNFLMLKEGYKQVKVFCFKIVYIKSDNNYIEIYTEKKTYIKRCSLESVHNLLKSEDFIRVHRSYIVNKNYIKALLSNQIEVISKTIPVSRKYLKALKKAFLGKEGF